jgi:hypothetical protein
VDSKDKKIIELAKKNRDLNLRVEQLKNKASKSAQDAVRDYISSEGGQGLGLDSTMMSNKSSNQKSRLGRTGAESVEPIDEEPEELKKKIKEQEKRIMKVRNNILMQ